MVSAALKSADNSDATKHAFAQGFNLFWPPLATLPGEACSLITILGLDSRGRVWDIAPGVSVTDSWTRRLQRGQGVQHHPTFGELSLTCLTQTLLLA